MPKLSAIAQEVKQGYVAEIHEALLRNETDNGEKKQSCILPSDFELKKASEMSLKDINFKLMSTAKSVSQNYFLIFVFSLGADPQLLIAMSI